MGTSGCPLFSHSSVTQRRILSMTAYLFRLSLQWQYVCTTNDLRPPPLVLDILGSHKEFHLFPQPFLYARLCSRRDSGSTHCQPLRESFTVGDHDHSVTQVPSSPTFRPNSNLSSLGAFDLIPQPSKILFEIPKILSILNGYKIVFNILSFVSRRNPSPSRLSFLPRSL